jgi:predicted amidophosphoribosyltransferase
MGFKSAFKGLTTTIVAPPSNASKWQMGFNSVFKGLTTTIVAPPSNASKWQMGFNSAFKGLSFIEKVTLYIYWILILKLYYIFL